MGPFLKENKYVTDEIEMAEMLKEQYSSVCSVPKEDIFSEEFKKDLFSDISRDKPKIENIAVNKEYVREHISKLKNNAAYGPDGVPTVILKRGGDLVEEAIVDLILSSMEEECIPDLLKWGWITPIWKGSDP